MLATKKGKKSFQSTKAKGHQFEINRRCWIGKELVEGKYYSRNIKKTSVIKMFNGSESKKKNQTDIVGFALFQET